MLNFCITINQYSPYCCNNSNGPLLLHVHSCLYYLRCVYIRSAGISPGCSPRSVSCHNIANCSTTTTASLLSKFASSEIPCTPFLHVWYFLFPSSISQHRLPTGYSDLDVTDPVFGLLWALSIRRVPKCPTLLSLLCIKRLPVTSKQEDRKCWR